MVGIPNIKKSSEYTDKWLAARQKKHIKMIEKSIKKLEMSIEDTLTLLETNKSGKIIGLATNLKQAQKIHKKVENLFYNEFNKSTKEIIDDFKPTSKMIEQSYSFLDKAVEFSSIDEKAMSTLRDGYYADWLKVGEQQKDKIIQGMYNQVIANARFSDLVNTVKNALTESIEGIPGKSLVQYSRLYAKDMIMDYHRNVNLMKAKDLGFKHWLYVGDIIQTTRPFCKTRAGKVYTTAQIESWTYQWAGKKGPAMQFCGGWNCRHHWQAVEPEWLDGKTKLDIGDWDLEHPEEAIEVKTKEPVKKAVAVKKKVAKPIQKVEKPEKTIEQKLKAINKKIKNKVEKPEKIIEEQKKIIEDQQKAIEKLEKQAAAEKVKEKEAEKKPINEVIKEQIKTDPVAKSLPAQYREDYVSAKIAYKKHFEKVLVEDKLDPYVDVVEWRSAMESIVEEELPFTYRQIRSWQNATTGPYPMALKHRAHEMEPDRAKVVFGKDNKEYDTKEINRINAHPGNINQYIKTRAMNQAYMEVKGTNWITLYRGTDGSPGKTLSEKLRQIIKQAKEKAVDEFRAEEINEKPFVMTDCGLVGYSTNKKKAREFGIEDGGITVRKKFKREDIFIHRDLMSGITRQFLDEQEFIVFGGEFEIPIKEIEFMQW